MSFLSNFPSNANDNVDDEIQYQEITIESNFHLVIPNDIFIDITATNSSENVPEECGNADLLENLGGGDFLNVQTPTAVLTTISEPSLFPEQKLIPQDYQNISVFNSEMKKDIEGIIKESVHLFQKDPREYHPFYLRVFKYLTIGQNLGHLSQGEDEGLKFWKKYDLMAVNMWKMRKVHPMSFSGEESPYATYINKNKVYINGQLITDKRPRLERNRRFNELERKARSILKEHSLFSCDIRSNLELRLKFLSECCTMTNPGDCRRMNTLWTKFCNNFGKESIKVHEVIQIDSPAFCNDEESSTNQHVVLQAHVESSDLNLSLSSSPPSPLGEEIEQKYVIPLEQNKTEDISDRVTLTQCAKTFTVDANSSKEEATDGASRTKRKKLTLVNQQTSKNEQKGIKIIRQNRFKKSKLNQHEISLARKVSKKRLKHTPLKQDKVLSVLEKKINTITKKLKSTKSTFKPRKQASTLTDTVNSSLAANTATPEFSMCEDCGQTYRTHYLSVHKEAVHNPNNLGRSCLLCPTFFKKGQNLWSHFLTAHMPDHLNPTAIAMQVEPVVEEKEPSKEYQTHSINKQTVKTEDSGPSVLEQQDRSWDCPHCNGKPFATKGSLQRHLHLVHGEGNLPECKLICSQCPKSFKEKAALTQHMKNFHQGIVNICDICGKKFQTPGKLWKHRVDYHGIISEVPSSNRGSVQCENCGENCLQGKQFINHVRNHHPEMLEMVLRQEKERRKEKTKELKKIRLLKRKQNGIKSPRDSNARASRTCPVCGKVLLHGGLSRHLIQTHGMGGLGNGVVKTYCCPNAGCEKQYKTRISLRIHISESHDPLNDKISEKQLIKSHFPQPGAKSFQCTLCGWMVDSKYECMMHIVLAHPHCFKEEGVAGDTVKCPLCEETGQDLDQIRNHVELVHSEGVWRCPKPGCKMVILTPVDLQEHFYKVHGGETVIKEEGSKRRRRDVASASKRNRSNWKQSKRKAKGEDRHTYRRRHGAFPCYRCKNVETSAQLLDMHVKKEHVEAYWPCKECKVVCFSERSRLFHQSVLCKVKKQKVITRGGVVGYDQMIMECPVCKRKVKAHWLSKHLNEIHGLIEDGQLWKCEFCEEDDQRQNFRTREYWLAHMDDCHGGEVNMEDLIEVARKINSKEEVNIEKIPKGRKRKLRPKQDEGKAKESSRSSKPSIAKIERRTKSGRVVKRKKPWSDESEDDDDNLELRLMDSDDEHVQDKRKFRTRTSRRRVNSLKVSKVASSSSSRKSYFDSEKTLANVPLTVRKMFDKQCSVRVKRLSLGEIEMARGTIKTERDK